MLKAVVDTNLFVSGIISPRGSPSRVIDAWHAGEFELLLSDWQYAELKDVFSRPKIVRNHHISPRSLNDLFARFAAATQVVSPTVIPLSLRDPKDEQILAAALSGGADFLVSGDDDLLVVHGDRRLGSLQIVTAAAFLTVLNKDK